MFKKVAELAATAAVAIAAGTGLRNVAEATEKRLPDIKDLILNRNGVGANSEISGITPEGHIVPARSAEAAEKTFAAVKAWLGNNGEVGNGIAGVTAEGHIVPARSAEAAEKIAATIKAALGNNSAVYDGKNSVSAEGHPIPSRIVSAAQKGETISPPQKGREV